MAKFKIGMAVRYIGGASKDPTCRPNTMKARGVEVVIVGTGERHGWDWIIKADSLKDGITRGSDSGLAPDECYADSCQLRPRSDRKADEFIERIKKLAREPMPAPMDERRRIVAEDRAER